jgi:ribosomal protein S21
MNKKDKEVRSQFASGYRPADLSYFEPLQISTDKGRFEEASRIFKSMVQKEKVISLYKEKQAFEKPSVKKRRKSREAQERKFAMELKQKMMKNGEWEKRMKKKQAKRNRNQENNDSVSNE